jgi:hypothetical protein
MSSLRKILVGFAVFWAVVLAVVALRLLPAFLGPALPAGATRLHIATAGPNLTFGCAAALLAPVRVGTSGDDVILVSVETGRTVDVTWPGGFGAWRLDGRAEVSDPWGTVVGREGDLLDGLGGGEGIDGAFWICPFGIPPAPSAGPDTGPVAGDAAQAAILARRLATITGPWTIEVATHGTFANLWHGSTSDLTGDGAAEIAQLGPMDVWRVELTGPTGSQQLFIEEATGRLLSAITQGS